VEAEEKEMWKVIFEASGDRKSVVEKTGWLNAAEKGSMERRSRGVRTGRRAIMRSRS
jgi:hypothetical protein